LSIEREDHSRHHQYENDSADPRLGCPHLSSTWIESRLDKRKASATVRDFENQCEQNVGDNSEQNVVKNRPVIVPLRIEV
jgi:hypothetical protein